MLEKKTYIQAFCTIENNKIVLNGETVFESENTGFADFSKKAYQHFEIGYPKFFKMDNLSKLAFLGSELLLKAQNPNDENNTALLFANKSSSLDTDVKYQNSISDKENYFPSPAVFVYTLANICLGEISIRHQLKSENSFFIFDAFNAAFMADYANILIETQKAKNVLCGWTEFFGEDYKAFLYLVGNEGAIENTKQNLEILYNK
ncbi:3-oxoacyl-ACP synthase [Flavobacterium noncentrifugens]|uniref:3-oxoacyl-ACP synthase n=1 Tax=Flavobacterium noncentrifugens TaxID=1128970 RepID=UPI000B87F511|nr:3-oxoacyl-ACP synthase [Flavobacterium noncentrifugens]